MIDSAASVLIVDDDADIRSNVADILQDLGYRTTTAACGESALDFVRHVNFDVVLLDYQLPGMDGASLHREIKKLRPSIAAIMITAWPDSEGARQARDAGACRVLQKPVNIDHLIKLISKATP